MPRLSNEFWEDWCFGFTKEGAMNTDRKILEHHGASEEQILEFLKDKYGETDETNDN